MRRDLPLRVHLSVPPVRVWLPRDAPPVHPKPRRKADAPVMSMILSTPAPAATWGDLLPVLIPLVLLLVLAALVGGRSR